MKKILCPTDFSRASDRALEYAVYIAQHANAHLSLLHVVHLPLTGTTATALSASEILGEQMRLASENLKAKCLFLEHEFNANHAGNFTCDYVLKEALLTDLAAQLTETEGYDLIVMGTTGHGSTIEELLVGSNTAAVAEEVTCPLLSVPATAPAPVIERIVYATDYTQEDQRALEQVIRLGSLFGADIHVVHAVKEETQETNVRSQQFWAELKRTYPDVPLHFQEITSRHQAEGLKHYFEKINGNTMAILRKEKSFLKELFSQSLAERMTYQAKVPLLVLHANSKAA
ncbi:universal stress protein [Pontibacter chitinilyticus]|uniref:universal stress protein n=1 Tax=Pontibacter chitinilyticus TaxID=2674989 RepID=UPI003219A311